MLEKNKNYFKFVRWELIELVPKGNNKILEIGCGEGNTGNALKKQGKAVEVVGIEKESAIADIAKTKIDKVLCANVETVEIPFSEGYFDYVIIGDVLEHLYDPWMVVNKLGRYLKKGGSIIASIPNIRNWQIVKDLVLKGEWKYCSGGILDDTHLRFFTKKSMIRLFQSENFVVNRIIPAFKFHPTDRCNIRNRFTFGLLEDFLTFQYIVEVRKSTEDVT